MWARRALKSYWALSAKRPLGTDETLWPSETLRTSGSLRALRTSGSLRALRTSGSLCSYRVIACHKCQRHHKQEDHDPTQRCYSVHHSKVTFSFFNMMKGLDREISSLYG